MTAPERKIETALVRSTKSRGGLALKLTCPGMAGMPDRMILMRGGHIGFVELKAPGQKPRPLQEERLNTLRSYGFFATYVDDPNQIEDTLNAIQTT